MLTLDTGRHGPGWAGRHGGVWVAAALAEIGLQLGIDLFYPRAHLAGGFAMAGLTAALGAGPAAVSCIGVVSCIAAIATAVVNTDAVGARVVPVGFVLLGSVLGVLAAVARQRRERSLVQAGLVASAAQHVMLRPPPARLSGYRLAARYQAATVEVNLGGDFFDVAYHPSGAVVAVIGDVKGHGLDAVETAALCLAAFRRAVFATEDLEELVRVVDRDVGSVLGDEGFVTALFLWLTPDGTGYGMTLGHPRPWLFSAAGLRELTELEPLPPLGLSPTPRHSLFLVTPQETLVAYTDGLTEARNRAGAFFPADDAALAARELPLDAQLDSIVAGAIRFCGGRLHDDVALLGIGFAPADPNPPVIALTPGDHAVTPTAAAAGEPGLAHPTLSV